MKKLVQETEQECIPVFKEHGFDWNLYRTGTRFYTYRIKSGDVTLLFNRRSHDQNAYSGASRPPIPFQSGQVFRLKAATDSGGIRPPH